MLSRTKTKDDMHFICMDNREKQPDGSINVMLSGGQEVALPPSIKTVPSLLLLNRGNRVLEGFGAIWEFLKPREDNLNMAATMNNQEPLAYSLSDMCGSGLSDKYSFLDMSADQLLAKGDGGLRQLRSYATLVDSQVIETPPDDYEADKVGNVDLGKITMARSKDIQGKT